MEEEYVKKVYDAIGEHFDQTRYNHWNSVKEFITSLSTNSFVFDAGSGNGKNAFIRQDLMFIGCDISETLANICNKKNLNVLLSDIRMLPFKDNTFDAVLCVAVLHHISLYEQRLRAINELLRVLKPGGKLFISVWALEQELTDKFINIQGHDYFVTWNKHNEQFKRYYHLFSQDEVKELFPGADVNYEKDNWNVIIIKHK